MFRNAWERPEIAGIVWRCLEVAGNGMNWLEMGEEYDIIIDNDVEETNGRAF